MFHCEKACLWDRVPLTLTLITGLEVGTCFASYSAVLPDIDRLCSRVYKGLKTDWTRGPREGRHLIGRDGQFFDLLGFLGFLSFRCLGLLGLLGSAPRHMTATTLGATLTRSALLPTGTQVLH